MHLSKVIKKNRFLEELINYFVKAVVDITRNTVSYNKIRNNVTVIIALRKLGDAVFTIPAIKEVQKNINGKLLLICFPETEPIYRTALNGIDIITLGHEGFYLHDRIAKYSARKMLSSLKPGTIIDLTGVITSATLVYSSGAEKIIGTNEKYFRSIYSEYIPGPGKGHMIEQYLNIVRNQFKISSDDPNEFESHININGYIIIHPFAGWEAKEWNFSKFISLAKEIYSEYDCYMIMPSGYIDNTRLEKINNAGIKIKETKDIDELISFISSCSVFVSNDSGPLQIAALLGKATFTIYGPTNPEFHLPFGKYHAYVQKNISCSPKKNEKFCFTDAGRDGCPSFECMNLLSVEEVIPRVMDFISRLNIKKKEKQQLHKES
jgi:heptosyltransferase-2